MRDGSRNHSLGLKELRSVSKPGLEMAMKRCGMRLYRRRLSEEKTEREAAPGFVSRVGLDFGSPQAVDTLGVESGQSDGLGRMVAAQKQLEQHPERDEMISQPKS